MAQNCRLPIMMLYWKGGIIYHIYNPAFNLMLEIPSTVIRNQLDKLFSPILIGVLLMVDYIVTRAIIKYPSPTYRTDPPEADRFPDPCAYHLKSFKSRFFFIVMWINANLALAFFTCFPGCQKAGQGKSCPTHMGNPEHILLIADFRN